MKFNSIAKRIFILVIPTILVTILSFVGLSFYVSSSQINKTINEKMQESLIAADLEIQLELYKNASIAINMANHGKRLDINNFNHEEHKKYLTDSMMSNKNTFGGGIWFEPYIFDKNSYYFGPFLYKEDDGEIIYIPEYGEYVDYFNEDWYIKGKASNGELSWSIVYYDPVSTKTMVTATIPFYDEKGDFIGVGTADMILENIKMITDKITVGETGKAFIIGKSGEYISFFDDDRKVNQLMPEDEDEDLARLGVELVENSSGMTTYIKDGKKARVYFLTMENIGWTLAIVIDEKEISSTMLNTFIVMITIPVLGLAFIVIGILSIANYIKKILNKVNNFADLAASGDFSKRIDVTEQDEFGFMEMRLNKMISNMNDMSEHSDKMLEIAEKASKSKGEFLSRMSHEIRTPMNAIIGMTQIAKSSGDPARIKDCLAKIENASNHLLALINDILDMSKIEANKLELSEEEFDLNQAITNIYNMMLVKTEEKQQNFTVNIEENVPQFIIGDELRLFQVITNLVSNAVKFTPEKGSISVDVGEIERNGDNSVIKVCVKDSGIGLSHEQQKKLFKIFEQGDGSISRKYGGSGLGLVISKHIIEMMNGNIWIVSELGEGSIFAFTIKVKIGTGITVQCTNKLSDIEKKSLRFLVVDDSVEANDYLKHILNKLSFECDSAYDGYEALEIVKRATNENRHYDIIFMDYMMPKLDGIETSKQIKELSDESTTIIMVSIYNWKDIKDLAKNVGIFKHITKPFTPSCILNSINEAAFGVILNNRQKSKSYENNFANNTILLVEDVDINREIVSAFLEESKVNIDYAENGLQAVEKFQAAPNKYDLILMDIQMPEMDGYEATKKIRSMNINRAKTIPIIAMTANALSDDVEMCKLAGMNDHMAKPIEPDTLLCKLSDYFFLKDYLDNNIY